jgi:hypothetical protein
MTSWTLSFWFKPGDSPSERILASVNHDVFQLRRLGNSLRFLQGGLVLAAFPFARRPGFRHVAITYRSISGVLRVYFDGIHQMEIIVPAAAPATTFNFGGSVGHPAFNATGDSLADILLYRAPLAPGDIGDIVALQPSWKSIEAWLPLTHSPVRPSLNFAATSVTTVVNGSWVWSDDPLTGIFPFREPHRNRVASKQRDEPR